MKDSAPEFTAPPDGRLTAEMCRAIDEAEVIILHEFVSRAACAALRQRALEDATFDTGRMYFIPGGHKLPFKKRDRRAADGRLVNDVFDESPFPEHLKLPAESPAGTLVVFEGRVPHQSGPNPSDMSRHAYTLHAIDRRCHYPTDNWLQRRTDLPLRGIDV